MIIGYIGYFFGRLIQAAVSRQREFLADASAVQFTRNPGGIAGALRKIGGYALGSRLATHDAAEIGHFFFAEGFDHLLFSGLLATHPPLERPHPHRRPAMGREVLHSARACRREDRELPTPRLWAAAAAGGGRPAPRL